MLSRRRCGLTLKVETAIFSTLEPVAKDVAGLTPEWFNHALEHSGIPATVADAQCEPIGIGQMGRSYRVDLTYSDPRLGSPSSVVVKMAGGGLEARQRVADGYRNEVMFYSQIAGHGGRVDPTLLVCGHHR